MAANAKKSLSVVIVDDNASMRSALRSIVKADGGTVVGDAADGKTALTMIFQLKPDVAIIDLSIPGISALEIMASIRSGELPKEPQKVEAPEPAKPETDGALTAETAQEGTAPAEPPKEAAPPPAEPPVDTAVPAMKVELHTAVIAISNEETQAMMPKAFELGAIGSVAKPFNADRVLTSLDQVRVIQRMKAGPKVVANAQSKTCILVDSDAGTRAFLKALLATENVTVIDEADNGLQSLFKIDQMHPDLVFLDVDMPELNGLNVLRCLHAVRPDLKVIMATARSEGEVVKEAVSQGVAGYLLKPFDSLKVVATVRKVLGKN